MDSFIKCINGSLSLKDNLKNEIVKKYINNYKEIKNKIDDLLEQLALLYINGNSGGVAEVMYNKIDKKIYLIEFSPRVPG